jgi:hypothetical protein
VFTSFCHLCCRPKPSRSRKAECGITVGLPCCSFAYDALEDVAALVESLPPLKSGPDGAGVMVIPSVGGKRNIDDSSP